MYSHIYTHICVKVEAVESQLKSWESIHTESKGKTVKDDKKSLSRSKVSCVCVCVCMCMCVCVCVCVYVCMCVCVCCASILICDM